MPVARLLRVGTPCAKSGHTNVLPVEKEPDQVVIGTSKGWTLMTILRRGERVRKQFRVGNIAPSKSNTNRLGRDGRSRDQFYRVRTHGPTRRQLQAVDQNSFSPGSSDACLIQLATSSSSSWSSSWMSR